MRKKTQGQAEPSIQYPAVHAIGTYFSLYGRTAPKSIAIGQLPPQTILFDGKVDAQKVTTPGNYGLDFPTVQEYRQDANYRPGSGYPTIVVAGNPSVTNPARPTFYSIIPQIILGDQIVQVGSHTSQGSVLVSSPVFSPAGTASISNIGVN